MDETRNYVKPSRTQRRPFDICAGHCTKINEYFSKFLPPVVRLYCTANDGRPRAAIQSYNVREYLLVKIHLLSEQRSFSVTGPHTPVLDDILMTYTGRRVATEMTRTCSFGH